MGKFRGWHIVAGIAAMVITGILGTVMGLNNTAAFMAGCVAFVGVALWTDSRIARRRFAAAAQPAAELNSAEQPAVEQPAARETAQDAGRGPALRDDR